MKNNVDLTENQLFSRRIPFGDMELGVLTLAMIAGSKFPWDLKEFNQIKSDDEFNLGHQKKSLIPLGGKKQRAEVMEYRKMDSVNYCDCCGTRMNLKLWDREIGICRRCDSYYEKDKDKCLWRKKGTNDEERQFSVFDMG